MSLKSLRSSAEPERERESLDGAPPVVVRVEADGRTAVVVSDGPNARANQKLALKAARGVRGEPLDAVLAGRAAQGETRAVHRTGPGDVIVFESAVARGDSLLCGAVAARMHDGMEHPVQAMRMLARPSRVRVGEHGAFQFLTLADPGMAARVSTKAELAAVVAAARAKPWPGGTTGLILRNAFRSPREMSEAERREAVEVFMEEGEGADAFVRRLADTNEVLSGGAVEAIPVWSLPMGKAQMFRENFDLKSRNAQAQAGTFTRLYMTQSGRPRLGFLPSFVFVTDEEEWAFKARTGRMVRTCAGLHPLRLSEPVMASDIATSIRPGPKGSPVIQALSLYRDADEVAQAVARRAARRGPSATPARPAPQAGSRPLPGRPRPPQQVRDDDRDGRDERPAARPLPGRFAPRPAATAAQAPRGAAPVQGTAQAVRPPAPRPQPPLRKLPPPIRNVPGPK